MHTKLHATSVGVQAKGLLRLLLCVITLSAFFSAQDASAQAMSGTYTVCSSGCNYSSVNAAASDLNSKGISAPVTIKIAAGSYNESVTVNSISGASASNTVTFQGAGKFGTKITQGTSSSAAQTVYLNGAKYVTFRDMTIEFVNTGSKSCLYASGASFCKIINCNLPMGTNTYSYGQYNMYLNFCTNMVYKNNRMSGSGYYGIYNNQNTGSYGSYGNDSFVNNIIHNTYQYPWFMIGGFKNVYMNNTVDSNKSNPYAYTYSQYEGGAYYYGNNMRDCYYNFIYYPNNYGQTTDFMFVNNMVSGNANSYYVIYLYNCCNTANYRVKFWHNTINQPNSNGYTMYFYNSYGTGWDIRSNIFSRVDGSGSTFSGPVVYMSSASNCAAWDGNDYYNSGGILLYWNGSGYNDLASLKAGAKSYGMCQNDQNVLPPYKALPDLHLIQTKPAPTGVYVLDKDADGDNRCKLFPTAGADESNFGKGATAVKFFGPNPALAGTPTVYYNTAKYGEPKIHAWYINGVKVSDSVHLETTNLVGPSVKIKLVTTSCSGKDSFEQTITVNSPTAKPLSDFIADKNTVNQGDIVNFSDLSTNGPSSWKWDITPATIFDNGNTVPRYKITYGSLTNYKLAVQFLYSGKYKICLTASNSKGTGTTECKVDYVEVVPSILMNGTNVLVRDVQGNLYDDGGPTGNYSYQQATNSVLLDPCASKVYLIVKKFDTYCGYDYLKIYDGPDKTTGTPIIPNGQTQAYCGNTSGGSVGYGPGYTGGKYTCSYLCTPKYNPTVGTVDTFEAKSGKMYIEFSHYYNYGADEGFSAYWWSTPKGGSAPTASFTSPDSICTNGFLNFTNTTKEDPNDKPQYFWDLDGDITTVEATSKNASYPFFVPGNTTVTLLAVNCGGVDTFQKTIVVFDPVKPKVAFHADNVAPTTNDIVYFYSDLKMCVDDYKWSFKPASGTAKALFMNGTSALSPNAAVNFPTNGSWTATLWARNVSGEDSLIKSCFVNVKDAYCIPSVSTVVSDIGISYVEFNDIMNSTSQGTVEYQNFTPTISTTVEIGVTYKLTVQRNSSRNKMTRTVWIDWNGDGDFLDQGEKVDEEINALTLSWTTDITIPTVAKTGATVMRIAVNQGNYANQVCGQNQFGEYEDYRLYIRPDATPPVITRLGKDTVKVEQGRAYVDAGATALDNLDGDLTSQINGGKGAVSTPKFNNLVPGTYIFTYDVTDAANNKAKTVRRVVIVIPDSTKPDLQVATPDTTIVGVFQSFTPPAVLKALDLVDGDLKGSVVVNNPVNTSIVGTYTVTYTVTDFNKNTATVYRYVKVVDTTAPTIVIKGGDTIYHSVGTPYVDAGVDINDNYYKQTDLLPLLTVQSDVNPNVIGTYHVTYTLKDVAGNGPVVKVRTVIVQDNIAPTVTMKGLAKIIQDVNTPFVDPGVTITDNYYTITSWDTSGTFYTAFPNSFPNKLGDYTITYCVTDGSGNQTCVTREVSVVDRIAPVITLKGDPSVTMCRWHKYVDEGYIANDNYWTTADVKITTEGNFTQNNGLLEGFYNLRYRAEDKSGNVGYSDWRFILVKSPADCGQTSISETDLGKQISIYPNPTNGKFMIAANLLTDKEVRIKIVNALGETVANANNVTLGNQTTYVVDLTGHSSGIYFVNIITNSETITKQIVLTK